MNKIEKYEREREAAGYSYTYISGNRVWKSAPTYSFDPKKPNKLIEWLKGIINMH